jgi:hypothetical protein
LTSDERAVQPGWPVGPDPTSRWAARGSGLIALDRRWKNQLISRHKSKVVMTSLRYQRMRSKLDKINGILA